MEADLVGARFCGDLRSLALATDRHSEAARSSADTEFCLEMGVAQREEERGRRSQEESCS